MRQKPKNFFLRVISLWLWILLFSAQHPVSEEQLYWAKRENLPEWAEQGKFRFVRLDGGRIESLKAERTWWGMNFPKQELEVLAHIYDRDFEKMLKLLKEANFNWIWVTWSNGWSLEKEQENRELLKKVIVRCHQEGIKVTAYLSACNIFWWDSFQKEPETKKWLLRRAGFPLFYGGSPHRVLADLSQPGWRKYILTKAELSLDAGADAIFYDNLFGDKDAIKLLISETQKLAEKKAQETGRIKALVYANVHIGPERFEINDHCDLLWDESGKSTPGVFETGFQIGNIRKLKFLSGAKQSWQPLKYENDRYHCGARESCIPSPEEQKLAIAEAYAWGADLSRNLEGRFLNGLIREEKPALDAWSAIVQYNQFLKEHPELYHRVKPLAQIALLSQTEKNPLADVLIKNNVMFQTKVLTRLDKGTPLNEFRVLLIPFRLKELSPKQEKLLSDFVSAGGKIFALNPEAEVFKKIQAHPLPIPPAVLFRVYGDYPVDKFLRQLQLASGGALLSVENTKYVIAHLTKKQGADKFILHLLNYDLKAPARNVKIKMDLADYLQDLSEFHLEILSPEENPSPAEDIRYNGNKIEFSLSQISRYMVAVISRSD